MKLKTLSLLFIVPLIIAAVGCMGNVTQSNDSKIAEQQEIQQAEGDAQVPPPSIVNWNEKRMLKLIQEKRDQAKLPTWTYTKNMDGKYTFVCESIGYGIPYNTRANNPMHYEYMTTRTGVNNAGSGGGGYYTDNQGHTVWGEHAIVPQAEPNGLFIPDDAKGTWNLCKDPRTGKPDVTYQEEDVSVFPYQLIPQMVEGYNGETRKEQ